MNSYVSELNIRRMIHDGKNTVETEVTVHLNDEQGHLDRGDLKDLVKEIVEGIEKQP